jgi:hypothetical protein
MFSSSGEQIENIAITLNAKTDYICVGCIDLREQVSTLQREYIKLEQRALSKELEDSYQRGRIFIRDAVQQSLKAMCKAVASSLPEDLSPKCSILAMKYVYKLKLSNHLYPSQYQKVGLSREELLVLAKGMEVYLRSRGLDMKFFDQLNTFGNVIAESVHSDIPIEELADVVNSLETTEEKKIELSSMLRIAQALV